LSFHGMIYLNKGKPGPDWKKQISRSISRQVNRTTYIWKRKADY